MGTNNILIASNWEKNYSTELQTFRFCDNTLAILVCKKKATEKNICIWAHPDSLLALRINFTWCLASQPAIAANHIINIFLCFDGTSTNH